MCLNPDCAYDTYGVVYVIHELNSDFIEIGISCDVETRLKSIQACNPHKLQVILTFQKKNPRSLELAFHRKFFLKRVHGEWFKLTSLDIEELRKHSSFVPDSDRILCGRWKQSSLNLLFPS